MLKRCQYRCRPVGHYHCPRCLKTIIRRVDIERHLTISCAKRKSRPLPTIADDSAPTTAAQGPKDSKEFQGKAKVHEVRDVKYFKFSFDNRKPLSDDSLTVVPVSPIKITSIPIIPLPVTSVRSSASAPVTPFPVTLIKVTPAPVTSVPPSAKPITSVSPFRVPVTSVSRSTQPITSASPLRVPVTSVDSTPIPTTSNPRPSADIRVPIPSVSPSPDTVPRAPLTLPHVPAIPHGHSKTQRRSKVKKNKHASSSSTKPSTSSDPTGEEIRESDQPPDPDKACTDGKYFKFIIDNISKPPGEGSVASAQVSLSDVPVTPIQITPIPITPDPVTPLDTTPIPTTFDPLASAINAILPSADTFVPVPSVLPSPVPVSHSPHGQLHGYSKTQRPSKVKKKQQHASSTSSSDPTMKKVRKSDRPPDPDRACTDFTHETTLLLLELTMSHIDLYRRNKLEFYKVVNRVFQGRGYNMTPLKIRKKLNNLIASYRRVLFKSKFEEGSKITWEYYFLMRDIFGGTDIDPTPTPEEQTSTIDSSPLTPEPPTFRPDVYQPATSVRKRRRTFTAAFEEHTAKLTKVVESLAGQDLSNWRREKERRRRNQDKKMLCCMNRILVNLKEIGQQQKEIITLLKRGSSEGTR